MWKHQISSHKSSRLIRWQWRSLAPFILRWSMVVLNNHDCGSTLFWQRGVKSADFGTRLYLYFTLFCIPQRSNICCYEWSFLLQHTGNYYYFIITTPTITLDATAFLLLYCADITLSYECQVTALTFTFVAQFLHNH